MSVMSDGASIIAMMNEDQALLLAGAGSSVRPTPPLSTPIIVTIVETHDRLFYFSYKSNFVSSPSSCRLSPTH